MVGFSQIRLDTGPGLHAPALRFLPVAFGLFIAAAPPVMAQQASPPAARPAPSSVPIPDALQLNKLVWSTMAAVHHANLAGNYSVLRDLSATGFQVRNDSASLGQTFSSLRQSGIDLSNTLLLTPTFSAPPKMLGPTVMQLRGFFGLRPTAIGFDLVYEWSAGRWRLFGVSISPANLAQIQPASAPPNAAPSTKPPATPPSRPRKN